MAMNGVTSTWGGINSLEKRVITFDIPDGVPIIPEYVNLDKCPRCGEKHNEMKTIKFIKPPFGIFWFYVVCPNTLQPVLSSTEHNPKRANSTEEAPKKVIDKKLFNTRK